MLDCIVLAYSKVATQSYGYICCHSVSLLLHRLGYTGHKSIATSQRYVDGAGQETRTAAARNPLYERLRRRD